MGKVVPLSIEAIYYGNPPILILLKENLDLNRIPFHFTEKSSKDIRSFELRINADSIEALKEYILRPMQNPSKAEFDWFKTLKDYLVGDLEFNLLVKIRKEDIRIAAPLKRDMEAISAIWILINKALDVIEMEERQEIVTYMRLTSKSDGKFLIVSYKHDQPDRIVNVDISKAIRTPSDQLINTYYDSPSRLGRWRKGVKWRNIDY